MSRVRHGGWWVVADADGREATLDPRTEPLLLVSGVDLDTLARDGMLVLAAGSPAAFALARAAGLGDAVTLTVERGWCAAERDAYGLAVAWHGPFLTETAADAVANHLAILGG